MMAKKCDICGVLYESYNHKHYDPVKPNGFMLLNIYNDRTYSSHAVNDCCPDCMRKINDLIYELKTQKEEG